ncbi:MAG: hypothetical protein V4568_06685 [Pseudomonadota bacterium]
MKSTDLEKNKGLKINNRLKNSDVSARYGKESDAPLDRRAQRKADQEKGLVPFAVKINSDLVKQIQALAQERQIELNEVVAELLQKGLSS